MESVQFLHSRNCQGVCLRQTPHYHCLVLEGGIDEAGSFHHIPIKDTAKLIEIFRRPVIKLFVDRGAALPQFCGAQFRGEDSLMATFRVFGG